MKKKVTISGMTCAHCAAHVERALSGIEGITSAKVNLEGKYAEIEAADSVADAAVTEAVYDAGFDVESIEAV